MTETKTSEPGDRRITRFLLYAAAFCLAAFAIVQIAVSIVVDASFVERKLNARNGHAEGASADTAQISIEDVKTNALLRRVNLRGIRVSRGSFRATIGEMSIRRIGILRLLTGGLHVGDIVIESTSVVVDQTIQSTQHPETRTSKKDEQNDSDQTDQQHAKHDPDETLSIRAARLLPELSIGRIRVRNGSVTYLTSRDRWTTSGIRVDLADVRVDSASARDSSRILFSRTAVMHVDSVRRYSADSLRMFSLGSVDYSSNDGLLTIDSLHFEPTVDDARYMRQFAFETNRVKLGMWRIAAAVNMRRLLEDRALIVERLDADSSYLDVYKDKRLPDGPTTPTPFPHQRLQHIGIPVRIDSVFLMHSNLYYSEIREGSQERGTVSFEQATITASNVSNSLWQNEVDPTGGNTEPATVTLSCWLFGSADLDATIRYWLTEPRLKLEYSGTLGETDVSVANGILFNLVGIRATSGRVDNVFFDLALNGDTATGQVRALYEDLEIEIRDKSTGDAGLKHRIATFIADDIKLQRNNPADGSEPPRTADVHHERPEGTKLIKFMWHGIRDGLLQVSGLRSGS